MDKREPACDWKTWWFAPSWGDPGGEPVWGQADLIHASSLIHAFRLARIHWPDASAWKCLGRPDPRDIEVCLPTKDTGAMAVVTLIPAPVKPKKRKS